MIIDTDKNSTELVYEDDKYVTVTQNVIANSLLLLAVVIVSLVVSSLFYFFST